MRSGQLLGPPQEPWIAVDQGVQSIVRFGDCEYGAGGLLVFGWSLRASMSMQTPQALEQQIHRAELGQEPVEIQIQTLLDDLSSDQDAPGTAIRIAAIAGQDFMLG